MISVELSNVGSQLAYFHTQIDLNICLKRRDHVCYVNSAEVSGSLFRQAYFLSSATHF
jgi:hypothetical protein